MMEVTGNRHNTYSIIAVAGLLAALTLFFHGSALQGYWRIDDASLLMYVVEYPEAMKYFFSPEQWQSIGVPFFTPWLFLDYWLDYALFGLNPLAFYAHNLFFVWLVALLTFVLLLRHVGSFWAGVAAILFLLGSPVVVVSQQLMSRHYATGLVFTILAMLFWLRSRRTESRLSLALATFFYLAAMLNKEVFAPLPLVLFFLDNATLKDRLRAMSPFVLTAVVFVAWRAVMLGKIIGGYGNGFHEAGNIATSLMTLPKIFFGEGWPELSGSLIILLAAVLLLLRSSRQAIPTLLAAAIAVSLPFLAIQVTPEVMHLRFAFLPWWGGCVLLSLGLGGIFHRAGTVTEWWGGNYRFSRHLALLAVLVFSFVVATKSMDAAKGHAALAAEFDVQGRFLWNHTETASYIPSSHVLMVFQFQQAMTALKKSFLQTGAPTAIPFADSAHLLAGNSTTYFYDLDCRCMLKTERATTALARSDALRTTLSLDVSMTRLKNDLVWHFTVPADSSCYMLFPEPNVALQLLCSGQISNRPPAWLRGQFRLFFQTTRGQWDVSPSMTFPEEGQKLKWSTEQIPGSVAPK